MIEPDGFWALDGALSPDGRTLAAAGATIGPDDRARAGQVRLYDISQSPPIRRAELAVELEGPEKANNNREWPFSSVAFTGDGRFVAAIAMTTVSIWDATTATLRDYFGRSSGSGNDSLAASPDGRWLAITEVGSPSVIDITPPVAP